MFKVNRRISVLPKRDLNPVFIGGAFLVQAPFEENKFGYRASTLYDISLTAISKEAPALKRLCKFKSGLNAYNLRILEWT